jgi:hypothetical protein
VFGLHLLESPIGDGLNFVQIIGCDCIILHARHPGGKVAWPRLGSSPKIGCCPGIPADCLDSAQRWRCRNAELLAALSRTASCAVSRNRQQPHFRNQKTATARPCKTTTQLRPKAFRRSHLAAGRQPPESGQQQLASSASLDSGSASTPETPGFGILQTTPRFVQPCRPLLRDDRSHVMLTTDRSMTYIACTGASERWPIRKIERHHIPEQNTTRFRFAHAGN